MISEVRVVLIENVVKTLINLFLIKHDHTLTSLHTKANSVDNFEDILRIALITREVRSKEHSCRIKLQDLL